MIEGGLHDLHSCMEIFVRADVLLHAHGTFNHSLLVSSSLPGDEVKSKPLKSYFRIRTVVESLPTTFTYKEIKEKALTKGISERSTCRSLKSLLELKYIDKQEDRYIRIKEFTDK